MKPRFNRFSFLCLAALAVAVFLAGCRYSVKKPASPIKTIAVSDEEEAQAVKRMKSFLAEIDKEDGDSWGQLAEMLKASTPRAAWSAVLSGMDIACGKKVSRGDWQGFCTEELPNSPKGRYFLFDIATKFERANFNERVVLVFENGQWKVAGYFRTKTMKFGAESKKP